MFYCNHQTDDSLQPQEPSDMGDSFRPELGLPLQEVHGLQPEADDVHPEVQRIVLNKLNAGIF